MDGGHSWDTIAADWKALEPVVSGNTTVVFDDYYTGDVPDGVGCQRLIEGLDRDTWEVKVLPVRDTFTKPFGELSIQMVMVRRNVQQSTSGTILSKNFFLAMTSNADGGQR